MKKFPVAAHLTDEEYQLLLKVYANHNSSMGLKERVNYSLSNIVAIERTMDENCLIVHFDNGEWFRYTKDGNWY
jgi:hypothetical protein